MCVNMLYTATCFDSVNDAADKGRRYNRKLFLYFHDWKFPKPPKSP